MSSGRSVVTPRPPPLSQSVSQHPRQRAQADGPRWDTIQAGHNTALSGKAGVK